MNIYRVAFIGQRTMVPTPDLEKRIDAVIEKTLHRSEHVVFSIGLPGIFDAFAAWSVDKVREARGRKTAGLLMIPHIPIKYDIFYSLNYDEILYPIAWDVHSEMALLHRDVWVVENSDLVIAYVEPDRDDDALFTLRYAKYIGVKCINLAVPDESDAFL